jgi:hypothetical protein
MTIETWPARTVYADVYRDGPDQIGFDAIRSHFGAWSVRRVVDRGALRFTEPIAGDLPNRDAAETYALRLVEAHTSLTDRSAA